ncbi:MAG: SGNH/GDSL hydrolase family protein [Candidatus Nanopelagicales bacterium]|nr:SGNH/GDSL hydrolase family protein [Candidatus Nanopelagicales bacterium]
MVWRRYVAVGDSFTEGIGDPRPDGRERGWADRVAETLADADPQFRYANLAIRGRRLAQIVDEQVPRATALQPDLVSFAGGVNDALRRHWDLASMASALESGIAGLRACAAEVVIVTYGRPSNRSRLMSPVEGRLAEYREVTYDVADRYGCWVVDFWDASVFDDPRFWSADRLHLNEVGHQRVALAVLDGLGMQARPWNAPLPPVRPLSPAVKIRRDVVWAGKHLAPWIGRRMTGRSSGDGVTPKRPDLSPVQ